jgi:hypothetical protein
VRQPVEVAGAGRADRPNLVMHRFRRKFRARRRRTRSVTPNPSSAGNGSQSTGAPWQLSSIRTSFLWGGEPRRLQTAR